MCSAIFLRMIVIGTISTLSPGLNAGICAGGPEGRRPLASVAPPGAEVEGAEEAVSMKPRMSFLVTRPLIPVPLIWRMSTLCSRAMRRTSGEDLCRRRSSSEVSASPVAATACTAGPASGCPAAAWGISEWLPPLRGSTLSAAGAEADFSPVPPMTATTAFTGTVSPSLTLISVSTPAPGEGISASTLSVEISKSGSSRSTLSPIFLIQRTMVPSAIDSPIWGITTLVGIESLLEPQSVFHQTLRRGHDAIDAGQERGLERRRVGDRRVHRRDPHDRRVEVLERLLGDDRRQLAADAAGAARFVEEQRAAGLGDRRQDRLAI